MRDLFGAVRTHHQNTNVTDMDRHVLEAQQRDSDTITATFETRLMNGTTLTQEPYPVFAIIKKTNNGWKAQSMTFAIEDSPEHNAHLISVGEEAS